VPRGLDAARCTGVILTDTMAMSPTIIPRERFFDSPRWSRSARRGCWDFSQSLQEILVGCREHHHVEMKLKDKLLSFLIGFADFKSIK